jgi:hypothetical protein
LTGNDPWPNEARRTRLSIRANRFRVELVRCKIRTDRPSGQSCRHLEHGRNIPRADPRRTSRAISLLGSIAAFGDCTRAPLSPPGQQRGRLARPALTGGGYGTADTLLSGSSLHAKPQGASVRRHRLAEDASSQRAKNPPSPRCCGRIPSSSPGPGATEAHRARATRWSSRGWS